MIIKRGEKAPFYGVLTPEERWRMKEENLEICDIFKDVKPPPDECPDCTTPIFWTMVAAFSVGIAAGVVLVSPK